MSGNKWTPGPWEIDGLDPYNKALGISARNAEGYKIPVVVWRGMGRPASEEGKANARLIAAAPDMLEALQESRVQIAILQERLGIEDAGAGTLSIIDAAIAKAEGRS